MNVDISKDAISKLTSNIKPNMRVFILVMANTTIINSKLCLNLAK